jgi:NAD(P)H-flavin reductase
MNEIQGARVVENREVARGTRWLVFESEGEPAEAYGPGNVLAFYVADLDGKWIRHPYTVSWAEGRRVGLLYRVILAGRATRVMAELRPGEVVRFGGRYGEPIRTIVTPDARAVIGVSTGTGIGPLRGFVREALATGYDRPITLYTGFRTVADIPYADELRALEAPGRFAWVPSLTEPSPGWTGLTGRVTTTVPARVDRDAHFHLVGNGAMVAELRAGLLAGGIPAHRVTQEVYFNRVPSPDRATVERIAAVVEGR